MSLLISPLVTKYSLLSQQQDIACHTRYFFVHFCRVKFLAEHCEKYVCFIVHFTIIKYWKKFTLNFLAQHWAFKFLLAFLSGTVCTLYVFGAVTFLILLTVVRLKPTFSINFRVDNPWFFSKRATTFFGFCGFAWLFFFFQNLFS